MQRATWIGILRAWLKNDLKLKAVNISEQFDLSPGKHGSEGCLSAHRKQRRMSLNS